MLSFSDASICRFIFTSVNTKLVMFVFLPLNTDRNIHYHTVSFAFNAYKMSLILVFIAEKSCEDNGRAAVEDVKKKKKRRKTKK